MNKIKTLIYFLFRRNKNFAGLIFLLLLILVGFEVYEMYVKKQEKIANLIEITNQETKKDGVLITKVSLDKPGYIVIHHKNKLGEKGDIIGNSDLLKEGVYENLFIPLSDVDDSRKHELLVMVHYDDGDGIPDFAGGDFPDPSDEIILFRPFTLINLNVEE